MRTLPSPPGLIHTVHTVQCISNVIFLFKSKLSYSVFGCAWGVLINWTYGRKILFSRLECPPLAVLSRGGREFLHSVLYEFMLSRPACLRSSILPLLRSGFPRSYIKQMYCNPAFPRSKFYFAFRAPVYTICVPKVPGTRNQEHTYGPIFGAESEQHVVKVCTRNIEI